MDLGLVVLQDSFVGTLCITSKHFNVESTKLADYNTIIGELNLFPLGQCPVIPCGPLRVK